MCTRMNSICVLCRMQLLYSNRQTLADLALGVATWTKRVARRICSSSTKPRKREDNDLFLQLSEVLDDWLSIEHMASHGKSLMDPTLFERLGDNALNGRILPHSPSDVGMDIGLGKRWLFSKLHDSKEGSRFFVGRDFGQEMRTAGTLSAATEAMLICEMLLMLWSDVWMLINGGGLPTSQSTRRWEVMGA